MHTRWALVLLLLSVEAGGANLASCRMEAGEELASPCRDAIAESSTGEILSLIEPWISARHFGAAQSVLDAAIAAHPRNAELLQRWQEVKSLAEEAAWLAKRDRAAHAPAPELDLALAETRCTRLTGETALLACDQVLRQRPADARALAAKGDALLALGRAGEALAAFRQALARQPDAALEKKIALADAANKPALPSLDQQLAALDRAKEKKLISKTEYDKQRSALLAAPSEASAATARSSSATGIDFGRYHALVIGNDAYQYLPKLETAIKDATAVAELLKTAYDFEVKLLTNATRADIVETLDDFRARLKATDNLVIYYAGHGWLDPEADKGFWLPIDAKADKRTQWVSNDTIRDALHALKAKHVLVIADSCFSGTLTRGLPAQPTRDQDYIKRMSSRKARQVLASGGLEPVADSGGSGHSPFAAALLDALKTNAGVLDGTSLFADLRRPVAVNSEQVPQFADIRQTGHQGGDFLFVKKR